MKTPLIEFQNVTLGYGRKVVLHDFSFAIYAEDFFGLVGPNGAGKTTMLRAMLGTLKPLAGRVTLHQPPGGNFRFGYVPQREGIDLILPYTVREVVMMGRFRGIGPFGRAGREDHAAVDQSLAHVGISDLQKHPFRDLSGGQKQRTLIARALAMRPTVLVLDEPTNGMDLTSRMSTLGLIDQLRLEDRLTVIMVTHLLDDVASYADRIALVEKDMVLVGTREEILTSERLSALYQVPINVMHDGKSYSITPGRNHDAR